jgi:gamma-glutamylcyclotransferase (GGCT)/AIG2-like uncharacterized protein YtfP
MAKPALIFTTICLLLIAAALWLRYPIPYQSPTELPVLPPEREYRVFVHGTLRSGLLRWLITGERLAAQPAALADFARQGLDVRASDGAAVEGQLLVVDGKALARLDRYERLGDRYQRWCMLLTDGTQAWVYRRLVWSSTDRACGQACELAVCGKPSVNR